MCVCVCVRVSHVEPPLPTSNPPKKKPKMGKSRSMSMDLSEDTAEDEYIPMDPIYTEPPPDEDGEQFGTPSEWCVCAYVCVLLLICMNGGKLQSKCA